MNCSEITLRKWKSVLTTGHQLHGASLSSKHVPQSWCFQQRRKSWSGVVLFDDWWYIAGALRKSANWLCYHLIIELSFAAGPIILFSEVFNDQGSYERLNVSMTCPIALKRKGRPSNSVQGRVTLATQDAWKTWAKSPSVTAGLVLTNRQFPSHFASRAKRSGRETDD